MKLIIGSALLFFLAGAPGYAQEPDKDKPQEEPRRQEEPKKNEESKKDKDKSKQQDRDQQDRDRARQNQSGQQNDRTRAQQDERNRNEADRERNQQRPAEQQDRATDQRRAQETEQHTDRDRNRGNGHRVPEERYRASFGREHHFHVARSNERRFQYGGYYFQYSNAWPSDWDYDDDVYIEDIDGEYYLFNPRHPGVRFLVVLVD